MLCYAAGNKRGNTFRVIKHAVPDSTAAPDAGASTFVRDDVRAGVYTTPRRTMCSDLWDAAASSGAREGVHALLHLLPRCQDAEVHAECDTGDEAEIASGAYEQGRVACESVEQAFGGLLRDLDDVRVCFIPALMACLLMLLSGVLRCWWRCRCLVNTRQRAIWGTAFPVATRLGPPSQCGGSRLGDELDRARRESKEHCNRLGVLQSWPLKAMTSKGNTLSCSRLSSSKLCASVVVVRPSPHKGDARAFARPRAVPRAPREGSAPFGLCLCRRWCSAAPSTTGGGRHSRAWPGRRLSSAQHFGSSSSSGRSPSAGEREGAQRV